MQYTTQYESPLGRILLAADGRRLTGAWFEGQKYFARTLSEAHREEHLPVLACAQEWLDIYFSGEEPAFLPPLCLAGTIFQNEVWEILQEIPYGETTTYQAIAKTLAARRGLSRMSAQAVGGAVARNPLLLFVPCHRVIGTDGSLTGYAGGIERKQALLLLERGIEKSEWDGEKDE